jgi:hypothetical protein
MEQGFRDEDGVESDAMPIKVVKIKLEPKGWVTFFSYLHPSG